MKVEKLNLVKSNRKNLQKKEMKSILGGSGYKCGFGCGSLGSMDNTGGSTQHNYDSN